MWSEAAIADPTLDQLASKFRTWTVVWQNKQQAIETFILSLTEHIRPTKLSMKPSDTTIKEMFSQVSVLSTDDSVYIAARRAARRATPQVAPEARRRNAPAARG